MLNFSDTIRVFGPRLVIVTNPLPGEAEWNCGVQFKEAG
jgi:hypothetical protein